MDDDDAISGSGPDQDSGIARIQIEAHDLALQMKPNIRAAKRFAARLAAVLATGYYHIRQDRAKEASFDRLVRLRKGGKDFFRAYVYWAMYDDLADEWEAMKGIIDQIVAALHVMNNDYLFKPGVIVTIDAVQHQIETTTWGGSSSTRLGLNACWSKFMHMQQAAAEESRETGKEKDRIYARHLEAEKRREEKAEAERRGIPLDEYRQIVIQEQRQDAEAARLRLINIINAELIRNG